MEEEPRAVNWDWEAARGPCWVWAGSAAAPRRLVAAFATRTEAVIGGVESTPVPL